MTWFPGAVRDPGLNAGYRRGRTSMQLAVDHFTVGTDSRALIRNKGLAQFLFPKAGPPFQFAEADAVCSHACEANRLGPGLEFERLSWDEPLTADQIRWGGAVSMWLSVTYGIPLVHYGGPRLPVGTGFRGFVNHGSLVHHACDQHTDGITDADFAAMVGGGQPAEPTVDLAAIAAETERNRGKTVNGFKYANLVVAASVEKDGSLVVHYSDAGGTTKRLVVAGPQAKAGKRVVTHTTTPASGDVAASVGAFDGIGRIDLYASQADGHGKVHAWTAGGDLNKAEWGSEDWV